MDMSLCQLIAHLIQFSAWTIEQGAVFYQLALHVDPGQDFYNAVNAYLSGEDPTTLGLRR